MRKAYIAAVAACALIAAGSSGQAQEKLKIGVLATLSGALTSGGEDGVRGAQVALKQRGGKIAGREVEFIIAATDASPDSALRAARKLVEQDKVQLILGPLSGSEGIAMRDYSKTVPNVTVVDASSGALETTYVNPSPNYFRFNSNGAMWMAGLGEYVFKDKGYKKLAVIGEDYSFPYTQVFGFALGYCKAGGQIVQRQWVPLGTKDFGSVIANIPDDVDAVFLGLGGGDAVNFLNQYGQTGGKAKDVILVGKGQGTLEDDLARFAARQGRVVTQESLPERGLFYRADHFSMAKRGVPVLLMMGIAGASDLVEGGRAAGQAWVDAYTGACYHQACDAVDDSWNLEGAAQDVDLMLDIGRDLATSTRWPEWKPGSEFKAIRDKSTGARQ